jgi:hypothetical protein
MVMICEYGSAFAGQGLGGGEPEGCSVSRQTLRGWMIVDGPEQDRRHRLRSPHQPRRRRDWLEAPSALVGLQQLPACTGPAQATQASRINGVALRIVSPAGANTCFNDSQPFRNRPSSGCKALVLAVTRGRSGRPVYSLSIPKPRLDNLSAGSLLRRSTLDLIGKRSVGAILENRLLR